MIPLIEVMKIVRVTSPLSDMLHLSSLKHGRLLALLRQSAIIFLFSFSLTLVLSSPPCPLLCLSFYLNISGRCGRNCHLFPPDCQTTMDTCLSRKNDTADELARLGVFFLFSSAVVVVVARFHFCLFSDLKRTVSSKFFDTQVPLISTEEFVLPRYARCVLSRLRCNGHSFLLSSYLSRVRRIVNFSAAPVDTRLGTPLISFCTAQLRTLCAARTLATLCLFTTSGPDPGELPGFWGSMVFRHASSLEKGRVTTTTDMPLNEERLNQGIELADIFRQVRLHCTSPSSTQNFTHKSEIL